MTLQDLRTVHRAQPFRPFDIHLADGRAVSVDHPELLYIPPEGRVVVVAHNGADLELIDLLLVTSLKVRTNGHQPKRPKRGGG